MPSLARMKPKIRQRGPISGYMGNGPSTRYK